MSIGTYRHVVVLQNPGADVPTDEGYTQAWTDLTPRTWHCSIDPATARDLERVTSGTVMAQASHVLRGRYHAGITTETRIVFGARTFAVTGVANPEERNVESVVIAEEQVA